MPVPIMSPYGAALVDDALPDGYLIAGDEVRCDLSCYGAGADVWARVRDVAPGTASAYPIKVDVPDRGVGQLRPSEVLERRVPEIAQDARDEIDRHARERGNGPGWCADPECALPIRHRSNDHA
jgi:hypothetical protein